MLQVSAAVVVSLLGVASAAQPPGGQKPGRPPAPDGLSHEAKGGCSAAHGALMDKVDLCDCVGESSWVDCYSRQAAGLGVPTSCIKSVEVQNSHAQTHCGCSPKHFEAPDESGHRCHFDASCDDCMGTGVAAGATAAGWGPQVTACEDVAEWADSDGDGCDWYNGLRCSVYGAGYVNGGYNARLACCSCGGGRVCNDEPNWVDREGGGCDWYKQFNLCDEGDGWGNDGTTAKMACCYCGGGQISDPEPLNGTGDGDNETKNDTLPTPAPSAAPSPVVPWPPAPSPGGPPDGGSWITWVISLIIMLLLTLFGGGGVLIVRRVRVANRHRRQRTDEEMELAGDLAS